MNILTIIGSIALVWYLCQRFVQTSSYQLLIQPAGCKKLPKLLLKLAKIEQDRNLAWSDLNEGEKSKVMKYYERFRDASCIQLTFLYNQNLIHIQLVDKSYFFPLDKTGRNLVSKEIGRLSENICAEFVLYRKPSSWFKSPILVGYLRENSILGLEHEEKEIEILFEFPEDLIRRSFFVKSLEANYDLKKDTDANYHKNELGDDEDFYLLQYNLEHKSGAIFRFQIEP